MKSLLSIRQKSDKSVEGLAGGEGDEEGEEDYSNGNEGSTAERSLEADDSSQSLLFNDDRTVARFGSAVTVTVDSSISFSLSDPFVSEEEEVEQEDNEEDGEAEDTRSVHSRSSTSSSGRHSRHSKDHSGNVI